MNIVVKKNYEELSQEAARIVIRKMKEKPDCVLGFATGNTPLGLYALLAKKYEEEHLDFSQVSTVNLEELFGVAREDPISFYYYMQKNLFSKVNIQPSHIAFPGGLEADAQKACREYDQIAENIDLLIVGIGSDGHIGFHVPSDIWKRKTSVCKLSKSERDGYEKKTLHVPDFALTLGFESLMNAKEIVLLAAGAEKAIVVRKIVYGDITPQVPASILSLHSRITLLINEKAAAFL